MTYYLTCYMQSTTFLSNPHFYIHTFTLILACDQLVYFISDLHFNSSRGSRKILVSGKSMNITYYKVSWFLQNQQKLSTSFHV